MTTAAAAPDPAYRMIPIDALMPSPTNPRKHFDQAALDELAVSIREKGIIVPLVARIASMDRAVTGGPPLTRFEVVVGERRYRAARLVGLPELPVVVRTLSDADVLEIQLVENVQRTDLEPLDEARGYDALLRSNRAKYSAAFIADRIGRSEKYVWDRLKLLDLTANAKKLLERGKILVGHAELLARLKPSDQIRAIDWSHDALFQRDHALAFEDDEDPAAKDPYGDRKAVSVKEFERWITNHVRFDVAHAAKAAPLEFGPVAEQVKAAEQQAGPKGKRKVIAITFDHVVSADARTEDERTYGRTSWKRADGTDGTSQDRFFKAVPSPTCDHSLLGVVAAGEHYGEAFKVCIARDVCQVHWKTEIMTKKKNAKLRSSGQHEKAAKREAKAEDTAKQREQERQARMKAWQKLEPLLTADAVEQVRGLEVLTAAHGKALERVELWNVGRKAKERLGADWWRTPAAALLVCAVASGYTENFDDYIKSTAVPLGLDVKRLQALRDEQQALHASAAASATGVKTKTAKAVTKKRGKQP